VDCVIATVPGIIVPENAVVRTRKGAFIYTVSDGTIHIRQVQLLGIGKGEAVVRGDIADRARVVVAQENKLLALSDGMKVAAEGR
jgi:copper homeostasis protein CutC